MPKSKSTVRLKDIAEKAGVSTGAVSFALNNIGKERRISKPTIDKIRVIAREMGYHPNIAARNLRFFGPSRNLFVVSIITSAESPLNLISHNFTSLQTKLKAEGSGRTFVTNISTFEPGKLKGVPGFVDGSFFNAAIITNTTKKDDEELSQTELPYPSILIGREIPGYSSFLPSWGAGKVAAKALLEKGVRNPAILAQTPFNQVIDRRVSHFVDTVTEVTQSPPRIILSRSPSEHSGHRAVAKALKETESPPFDGLFCVHDSLAIGAYLAIRERGLTIPGDIKVIGIGDSEMAPFLFPALSTAGAEEPSVYTKASALFLERIQNPSAKPKVVRVRAKYIEREST